MSRTLYVSDLDGTLLNRESKISKFSCNVINDLVERGMFFTYATARSLSSAEGVTRGLCLKHPVVGYNGAFLFHPQTGEILDSVCFSREEIDWIKEKIIKYHLHPLVYSLVKGEQKVTWQKGYENKGTTHYLNSRKGDRRLNPVGMESQLFQGGIFYFTIIGEKQDLEDFYQEAEHTGRYVCTFQQELYRTEYWFEIMPREATKAEAILKIKEKCGCDRIVSFGDAVNDIPMFRISDESYAVENAVEELKRKASGVIASNEEDGVAKWLLENF